MPRSSVSRTAASASVNAAVTQSGLLDLIKRYRDELGHPPDAE
jgi:hypothetical protein